MFKSGPSGAEEEDERRGGPKASFQRELTYFEKVKQRYVKI